jgi:hypothetical protein
VTGGAGTRARAAAAEPGTAEPADTHPDTHSTRAAADPTGVAGATAVASRTAARTAATGIAAAATVPAGIAAATAASSATAAAAVAAFARTGLVDPDVAPLQFGLVELFDRLGGLTGVRHLDEAEALGLARKLVGDYRSALNLSGLREKGFEILAGNRVGQVADVQLAGH